MDITPNDMVCLFVFLSGAHYNLTNIYEGIAGAKSKVDALKKLFPYIQIYVLAYLTSYSQFFQTAVLLFFGGLGLFQTYVAGLLNISSTSGIDFQYLYFEPVVYLAILYLDVNGLAKPNVLIGAYALLTSVIFAKYCLFLHSIIKQLTEYLNISLLKVKEKKKTN